MNIVDSKLLLKYSIILQICETKVILIFDFSRQTKRSITNILWKLILNVRELHLIELVNKAVEELGFDLSQQSFHQHRTLIDQVLEMKKVNF